MDNNNKPKTDSDTKSKDLKVADLKKKDEKANKLELSGIEVIVIN